MPTTYENFDIDIARAHAGYEVRVRSPGGEARAAFALPLSEHELRILGLTVARGRGTTRSVPRRDVDEVKAFGERLFNGLFAGDVLACYHESLARVRSSPHRGLRVRLRLGDVPELAQVPWEYLFDRRNGRFLALDDETPVVRYLDMPVPAAAIVVQPPLRVLVMIAAPSDVPHLDGALEWQRLNEALGDLVAQRTVRLDRLDNGTLSALRWRLREDEYHVFHFIGHGGVDQSGRGVLILEDAAGRSDVVDAETVAGILAPEKTLRLAVLNACEGGRAAAGDLFAGTAQALVQQDVPAVVAMQFEISDAAAIALTHDFYRALAYGDPVDAALTEARRGLRFERRNELEWGTPVLYMRASDGRLFDMRSATSAPAAPAAPIPAIMPGTPAGPLPSDSAERPRPVLWLRIGRFAIGAWAFAMLAMLALPTTRSLSPDGMIAGSPDPGGTQDTAPIPQPGAGARPLPPAYDSIPSLDADAATVGLAPVGAPFFGSLAADTSYEHEVFLEQGPHTIAASCDAGCDDIDLTLIDRGVTIAEDTEYNDTPAVTTTVPARGTYQLRVHMITCARPACGYRVQVYRRP